MSRPLSPVSLESTPPPPPPPASLSSSTETHAKFPRGKGDSHRSHPPPPLEEHYQQPHPQPRPRQVLQPQPFTPFIPRSISHQTWQQSHSVRHNLPHQTQYYPQQQREFNPRYNNLAPQHRQLPFRFHSRDNPNPPENDKTDSSSGSDFEWPPKPSSTGLDITQIIPPPVHMGRKGKGRKAEPRVTLTVAGHVSDSPRDQTPPSSAHGQGRSSRAESEKAPTMTPLGPPQGVDSEPSSIRPSPPSSTRILPEDRSSAHSANLPKTTDGGTVQADDWGTLDVGTQETQDNAAGLSATSAENSAVPTWTGPAEFCTAGRYGGVNIIRTTNNVAISHPRRWGAAVGDSGDEPESDAAPTPVPSATRTPDTDCSWNPTSRLHQWVTHHQQGPPASPVPSLPAQAAKAISEASSDFARPNSAREKKPPVTIFYSDSEAPSPQANRKALEDEHGSTNEAEEPVASERATHTSVDTASVARSHVPTSSQKHQRTLSRQWTGSTQPTGGGSVRPPRPGMLDNMSQWKKWWKKESHPVGCPTFASRRIRVTTPFNIRTDDLKTSLYDHFSRYGAIRCIVPTEQGHKDSTDKMTVVFKDEEAIHKVQADEKHKDMLFRSTYSRSGSTNIGISVSHYPLPPLSYVWVKVSGKRFDSRSRSASPIRDDGGWGTTDEIEDTRTLPESIAIFALPKFINKTQSWVYRSEIIQPHDQMFWANNKTQGEGKEPIFLTEIQLGRRFAEKEFLPKLIDYFVDIHDTVPPGGVSSGWVFGVASSGEARYLMNCLAVLPGVTARFARDSDRFISRPDFSPAKETSSSIEDEEQSPTDSHPISQLGEGEAEPVLKRTVLVPPPSLPTKPVDGPLLEDYSHLERKVVLTYRGRLIREELDDGQARYIDDAAIFVGRLVKEQENTLSLLKRFENYGKVVCVEYNPMTSNGTYGTARVFFQDAAAAKRAIEWENGAVSFGSAIKVEPRKVLPMDVQARAMYVDSDGRAVSPSIAHQYQYLPRPPPTEAVVPPYEPPAPVPPPPRPPPPPAPPATESYPASWYSVMGPQAHWMSQMFIPPHPVAPPIPVGSPPPEDRPRPIHPSMMPMMWQFGVGFYPPAYAQQCPYQSDQPQPQPYIAPMSPLNPDFQAHMAAIAALSQPVSPEAAAPEHLPPVGQVSASNQGVTPSATGAPPSAVGLTDPASEKAWDDDELSQENKTTLRAVGSKYEDGVFKVLYDPQELKQYREEHQLEDSPPFTPAPSLPPQSPESPILPRLPLHTGGHDPFRRPNSQVSSYRDLAPKFRYRGRQDFDASGRRSSFVSPMGNQFPEPIGPRMDSGLSHQVVPPSYGGPHGDRHGHHRRMGYEEHRGRMGGGGSGDGSFGGGVGGPGGSSGSGGPGRRFNGPNRHNRMGGGGYRNNRNNGWDQVEQVWGSSPQPSVYAPLPAAKEQPGPDFHSPPQEYAGGW